jgi:hypothetical protein
VALYFFLYRTHTPVSFINCAIFLRPTGKLSVFNTFECVVRHKYYR